MKSFSLTKAPSAQNAIALIGPTKEATLKNIIDLARGSSPPSYEASRALAPELMEKGDLEWCLSQCSSIRWELQRRMNEDLLTALHKYRGTIAPRWYRRPMKVHYEGHRLSIPLQPMGVWSDGRTLSVDWLQPWKHKSMSRRQLDILFTLHAHRFLIGNYFGASFRVINLMADPESGERSLEVLEHDAFTELADDEVASELTKLAEALEEFRQMPREPTAPRRKPGDGQMELPFDNT